MKTIIKSNMATKCFLFFKQTLIVASSFWGVIFFKTLKDIKS